MVYPHGRLKKSLEKMALDGHHLNKLNEVRKSKCSILSQHTNTCWGER